MRLLLRIVLFSTVLGCTSGDEKRFLERISLEHDPVEYQLQAGFNDYVKRAFLDDETELGLIALKDGSTCKYWFRSHHVSGGVGGTWFEMTDGNRVYMRGWFCCEVQLPDSQMASVDQLQRFIEQHDGVEP